LDQFYGRAAITLGFATLSALECTYNVVEYQARNEMLWVSSCRFAIEIDSIQFT